MFRRCLDRPLVDQAAIRTLDTLGSSPEPTSLPQTLLGLPSRPPEREQEEQKPGDDSGNFFFL